MQTTLPAFSSRPTALRLGQQTFVAGAEPPSPFRANKSHLCTIALFGLTSRIRFESVCPHCIRSVRSSATEGSVGLACGNENQTATAVMSSRPNFNSLIRGSLQNMVVQVFVLIHPGESFLALVPYTACDPEFGFAERNQEDDRLELFHLHPACFDPDGFRLTFSSGERKRSNIFSREPAQNINNP
ncbi:tRNA guanine-N7 methyltransferase [Anopheles sinensis]|uniref:tRNA guanine-N7 methyltransferase n=1 Tax=Anopheles sinensis TaxID=74873 RepID=A0A084VVY8_ANOSI|nr:tRNA guanine-N7 methyltransferase [Anopheles sinensis]